jgi:hypothetical protein
MYVKDVRQYPILQLAEKDKKGFESISRIIQMLQIREERCPYNRQE